MHQFQPLLLRGRWRPAALVRAAAIAAALGASVSIALPASASVPVRYVLAVPSCQKAKPHHATCFAMVLKTVPAGTSGARRFVSASGAATIGPAGGLTPSDLASAYNFNSSVGGSGQLVAIIDWGNDSTIASDLNKFDSTYGLSGCTTSNGCFKKLNESGKTSPLPSDQKAADEISLDVESVHSVCQNCKIDLIEVKSSNLGDIAAGVNEAAKLGATEISNSYGAPDPSGGYSSIASAYNHPGIVITASTGDDGYYGFDKWISTTQKSGAANDKGPNFPSELPTVVAVGGTSLYLSQSGSRQNETVWNDNGQQAWIEQVAGSPMGGSGGGCSLQFSAKPWQTALSGWSLTACGSRRLGADVSALGDPYTGFDIYNTSDGGKGWSTVGGTSLAAPLIAAMWALSGGAKGVAYPALTLYGHLGSSSLFDVTTGGNGFCAGEGAAQCGDINGITYKTHNLGPLDCDYSNKGTAVNAGDLACDAAVGYDGPSGVGTPNGLGAFLKTGPNASIQGPTSISHSTQGSWSDVSSDPFPGGKVVSYQWNWGDGVTDTTTTSSDLHVYQSAGNYTISITVTDNYGMTGTNTLPITVN